MRTAVFTGVGELRIENCPMPSISLGKILIRVDACALCTWEQRVYTGVKPVAYPFIGGHEIAGTIVGIGEGVDLRNWKIGDTVVYGTNLACGDCYFCKTGNEQNCLHFDHSKQLEGLPYPGMGGLSEYLLAEPKHLFKYKNVTPSMAALTEPLSCVIHSCEVADIRYGDTVVIIGAGIMGMLHALVAIKSGAVVIVSDIDPKRLRFAQQAGVHYALNPDTTDLEKKALAITDGLKAQVVIDTTPIASVAQEALKLLAFQGRLVLYSSFYPDQPVSFSPNTVHVQAHQILGSANSNSSDFMKAAKLISERIIDTSIFVAETYPLDEVKQAFESAIQGDKYRVVVSLALPMDKG